VPVSLDVRDLLVASWELEEEQARKLLSGLVPAAVDGRHLVSIVSLGRVRGRVGKLPLPPFSQINVRGYALHQGAPAVVFLRSWVTAPGVVVALAGVPVGIARIRAARGRLEAPGVGVRIHYEPGRRVEAGPLGRHELGLFHRGSWRSFAVRRGPADWQAAEPEGEIRADPLLSLGLEPRSQPSLLYAHAATFEILERPRRVDSSR
jgi:uncharacterized protein YqjF (DUF2071 family)